MRNFFKKLFNRKTKHLFDLTEQFKGTKGLGYKCVKCGKLIYLTKKEILDGVPEELKYCKKK